MLLVHRNKTRMKIGIGCAWVWEREVDTGEKETDKKYIRNKMSRADEANLLQN